MESEVVTTSMEALLTQLTLVSTKVLDIVAQVCTTIVAQPFLLLTTGILLLGGAVGVVGRLLSRG